MEIVQEIEPIKNKKKLVGLNINFVIPEGYDNDEIILSPKMFSGISEYRGIMPGDKFKINLKVTNESLNNYKFVDNSFILETDDITKSGTSDNFSNTGAVGFDGRYIYDMFSPYRTFNGALNNLLGNNFDINNLGDEVINNKLIDKGYNGINDLDKYYLDYYNNKYNLSEIALDKFTYSTISEMFSGNISKYRETNPRIIEVSYNYFYNKLLSFNFDLEKVTDSNSDLYSIGEYMRKGLGQDKFMEAFNDISSNSTCELSNMSLNVNGRYTTNVYMYYNFSGYMEFRLKKTNSNVSDVFKDDLLIMPPNTGI